MTEEIILPTFDEVCDYITTHLIIVETARLSVGEVIHDPNDNDNPIILSDIEYEGSHLNDRQYFFGTDEVQRSDIYQYAVNALQ